MPARSSTASVIRASAPPSPCTRLQSFPSLCRTRPPPGCGTPSSRYCSYRAPSRRPPRRGRLALVALSVAECRRALGTASPACCGRCPNYAQRKLAGRFTQAERGRATRAPALGCRGGAVAAPPPRSWPSPGGTATRRRRKTRFGRGDRWPVCMRPGSKPSLRHRHRAGWRGCAGRRTASVTRPGCNECRKARDSSTCSRQERVATQSAPHTLSVQLLRCPSSLVCSSARARNRWIVPRGKRR
jgi:hypothetical protein